MLIGKGAGPTLGPAHWENRPQYSDLGRIPVQLGHPTPNGIELDVGFYEMNGNGLVRAALKSLPETIEKVLDEANLSRDDIDLIIAHQPNVKMIEVGFRALGLDLKKTPMPVVDLGNMGPASILVNYDMAKKSEAISNARVVLLLAFGLGFFCGAQILRNNH